MHIPRNQMSSADVNMPHVVARQAANFGDAGGLGVMEAEYMSLGAGTDIAPLLKGMKDEACQVPHWGYMMSGELVVSYTDGRVETCKADDLFYWPPGHGIHVTKDSELVLFSPRTDVMTHSAEE